MKRQENMPDLVYWGLWGINSRIVALTFQWFSVLLAVGSAIIGFFVPIAFIGVIFLAAAAWYQYAIKWVDTNSSWKTS